MRVRRRRATGWLGAGAARAAGIGLVYQEPNLAPDLTVAENVFMGRLAEPLGPGRLARRSPGASRELAAETGHPASPRAFVRELSPDQRQLVEIAKVVGGASRA